MGESHFGQSDVQVIKVFSTIVGQAIERVRTARPAGPHKALRSAEQAMYNAKRTGKNRVWTAAV